MVEIFRAASRMEFGDKLARLLGFEPKAVRRIIIDLNAGDPFDLMVVYVELYASDQILTLDWPEALQSAKVEIVGKESESAERSPDTP